MSDAAAQAPVSLIPFKDMALSAPVQKGVAAVGYETPSPIQAQVIPHLLEGSDILGVAQTGTGKTAAFALPTLSRLDIAKASVQVLCLTPTRELAIQVAEAFQTYAKFIKKFNVLPIYGGTDYGGQIRQLKRGVHVVVGTPGRVMDHLRKGTLVLDDLQTLVLDEADEMLRMGFIDDVEWILQHVPDKHQTALFSATMPPPIKKLTKKYLSDPVEVMIKVTTTTSPNIRQRFIEVRNNDKLDTLTRVLDIEQFDAIIIFVRTRNLTQEVAERLQARGYAAEALNGDVAQNQREKIVNRLRKGQADIVVATDVAARGLDVERISHVINYDVPYDTESYVHRIGRTGRAGRAGDAVLFVTGRERRMLQSIEKTTRQKVEPYEFPSVEALNEKKMETLFTKIDTELQKDLAEYESVIGRYLHHNEVDPVRLAAAMASLEAGSEPFYLKKSAKKPAETRSARTDDRENRAPSKRRERASSNDSRKRDSGDLVAYRLEVGTEHGVEKGNIVGAIANEAGIESQYMGKIALYENHSVIELPADMPKEIFKSLKKVWVCERQLQISLEKAPGEKRAGVFGGAASGSGRRRKSNDADSAATNDAGGKKTRARTRTPEQIAKGKAKKVRKRAEKAAAKKRS